MSGGPIRGAMRQLMLTVAFGGSIAALIILFGTRDLEGYEISFFSLARGTAVQAVHVLGHPVYTLAIGLGVRLPLDDSFGSSPAAAAALFLPAPVTYWLLLTFSIGSALLVVRHALEPLCGRFVTWVAAVLLFCSVPMVTYTLYNDWLDAAFTYCCLVACVFAPHALLTLLALRRSSRVPRVGALLLGGLMWGAVALSHPGHWPQVAVTLVCASGLALCRSDHPWRNRLTAVALLATVSLLAVAPQVPDIMRELNVPGAEATTMIRPPEGSAGELIASNLFPFGDVGSRLPFSYLVLALLSLAIGLTLNNALTRRLAVGAALLSVVLGIGATLPSGSASYSPSAIWTLRDSAAAFAILSATGAVAGLRGGSRVVTAGPALAVLLFAALQGPSYAARLVFTNSDDQLSNLIASWGQDHGVWTRDMTPPGERAWLRGLPRNRGLSGERLALWPGVLHTMRDSHSASTDFADAGYTLVTAWTKQRTMRGLVRPNDVLFNQTVELSPRILCDGTVVAFLQLRYLLTPRGIECAPWKRIPGVLVDDWLEFAVVTDLDDRVRALPLALVSDRIRRQPALSADSSLLLSALLPVSGTSLRVGPRDVVISLDDPSAAAGHALVLPVAYDPAWRASDGTAQNLGGLLALTGVDQHRLTLEFVPDGVALLRAVSMTVAQVLAFLGFLGLMYVRPDAVDDAAVPAPVRRVFSLSARWGRHTLAVMIRTLGVIVRPLRQPRNWLYAVYSAAIIWQLPWRPEGSDRTALLTGMLLPLTTLATARLTHAKSVHRSVGGALLALALLCVAARGSLSAEALNDPLFWGVMATVALMVSVATRRWPIAARTTSACAGACAMVATLLPVFPNFESNFPDLNFRVIGELFTTLSDQLGMLAALGLLGLWLQAIAPGNIRTRDTWHISAAARGALLAGLVLSLAGAIPKGPIDAGWLMALGMLLGLAESKAR